MRGEESSSGVRSVISKRRNSGNRGINSGNGVNQQQQWHQAGGASRHHKARAKHQRSARREISGNRRGSVVKVMAKRGIIEAASAKSGIKMHSVIV